MTATPASASPVPPAAVSPAASSGPAGEAAPGCGLEVTVRPGQPHPAHLARPAGRADQARHDGAEPGQQHGGADAESGGQREHRPDGGHPGEHQRRHRLQCGRPDQHRAGRQPVEQQAGQRRERGDGNRDREEHRGDRPGMRALVVDQAGQGDQDEAVTGGDDRLQADGQPQRVPRGAGRRPRVGRRRARAGHRSRRAVAGRRAGQEGSSCCGVVPMRWRPSVVEHLPKFAPAPGHAGGPSAGPGGPQPGNRCDGDRPGRGA